MTENMFKDNELVLIPCIRSEKKLSSDFERNTRSCNHFTRECYARERTESNSHSCLVFVHLNKRCEVVPVTEN